MTTPQPWRFLEPYWDVRDVLGWLIDRDPKRFGRIFNPSDLPAATLYIDPARKDDNPTRTLLHAFREGQLQAFRDGQRVPVEFWSTRSAANVLDDVDTRVRRNDALAIWPELWKWAQAVVWAVWRDEELAALCDQDRLRYAECGAERFRAGLRPAGSEQDLRTLLRAGQITARTKKEGDNSVNALQPESWPQWAGMPSGWREDDIAFDAGEMRRELPYVPEAQRPAEPFKNPDWVEHRGRRLQQILRFRECQRLRRRWLSFEEIADWCAREPGSVRRTEGLRAQAYADLRDAMLAGEFGHGAGSRVLYFHPDPGAIEERLRLAPAGLRTWLDFYGADDPLITTQILSRCWLPHDLCRQWFERQGLVWPSAFDPATLRRAPTASAKRSLTTRFAATREKWSIADQEERSGSLHADTSPPEKPPNAGKQRAAYRAALSAWMAPQQLPHLQRMGPAAISLEFKSHCERHSPGIVPLLPKRLRSMEGVIERIIKRRVEALRT